MSYVEFSDNGYEYLDIGRTVLFSSDIKHDYLFDYITKDLSCLPAMFETYVSERMDTTTFELKESQNSNIDINTIIETLKSIHPYFEHDYRRELQNKIGDYFNKLLVYTIYTENEGIKDDAVEKEWYFERLKRLISSSLWDGDACNDFYYKFIKWIGHDLEAEFPLIPNMPRIKPTGFIDEIMTQKTVYNILYFILDISVSGIDNLTMPQRIWLYGNIYNNIGSAVNVTQKLSFLPPIRFRIGEDRSQEADYHSQMYDLFQPLHALYKLDVGYDSIPTDMLNDFNTAIEYAKTVTDAKVYTEYEISSLRELLYLELMSMIQSGIMIRKCKNCGKYFVVNNRKIAYCDRTNKFNERCSAVGPMQSFQKKMKDDEPLKMYNRAYKAHHARYRSGTMSKEELSSWCSKGKEKLKEVRTGKLDISSFQKWLKD